jgi:predicted nucleic acid-binding protein
MISADTNLFVYAYDSRNLTKQSTARLVVDALGGRDASVGLQVVGEVQNALRKRLRAPPQVAYQLASDLLTRFVSFAYDERAVGAAIAEASAGRLNYWDALLLAAANGAGVRTMLSEDMSDGLIFGGLEVINPFGPDGPTERVCELLAL